MIDAENQAEGMMTFGGHLEVLRQMLFRIVGVFIAFAVVIFCFKEETFTMLLAPREWDFVTYRVVEHVAGWLGVDFHFTPFSVDLISTDLSAQFMAHLGTSCSLALLASSPYIVYELFRFISPALYENERKYAVSVTGAVYVLFIIGLLISYFIVFPISFRFLATYEVDASVKSTITIASYIDTFTSLSFLMGIVFQLPVVVYFLAKMGIVDADVLRHYRRHAIILIMIVAAIITPPDLFTLFIVSIPMYLLYELSIWVIRDKNQ